MISFIVTTYNLEDWLLRRCLESIVTQGFSRDAYEIIVVDDESTISPKYLIDEFAERANIVLYIQKHARQGAARNLALQHAKGKWIQFIDGDDYLFPGILPPLLKLAQDNELDLLTYGFREVADDSEITLTAPPKRNISNTPPLDGNNCQPSTVNYPLDVTSGDTYMLHHNLFGSCCTLLFRLSLCESESFGVPLRFTENIYIEDEEFITKLVWRARRMASTDAIAYAYYQRHGSTVHNCNREHTDELFSNYFVVLKRLIDFEKEIVTQPHEGLTRKIRFFAIDILRRSLREPDWKERWYQSAMQLLGMDLYPIPPANYSWKYRLFRTLSTYSPGRHILRWAELKRL